jgi:hypothetical protein
MTRRLWRRARAKLIAAVAVVAVVVAGGLFVRGVAPVAHADFFDGCHAALQTSAKASQSGYTLTVGTYARFASAEDGGGYCGTMIGSALISEPANGAGGTLTVTLVFDTGSVSSSATTGGGGASGATFSATTVREATKCAHTAATFTSTSGVSLSATTKSACA